MVIEGPGFSSYEHSALEDRSAPRMAVAIPARFRGSGGRGFQTVVRDISLSGFRADALGRLYPGMTCWLTVPGLEPLQAQVAWWSNGIAGCGFANLLSPVILERLVQRWPVGSGERSAP